MLVHLDQGGENSEEVRAIKETVLYKKRKKGGKDNQSIPFHLKHELFQGQYEARTLQTKRSQAESHEYRPL